MSSNVNGRSTLVQWTKQAHEPVELFRNPGQMIMSLSRHVRAWVNVRSSVDRPGKKLPSGNLLHNYGKSWKITTFSMEKTLFQWPFSIAILT